MTDSAGHSERTLLGADVDAAATAKMSAIHILQFHMSRAKMEKGLEAGCCSHD